MSDLFFKREWLLTNGLGGFASSTVSGANTRRYHGLLIAATKPPAVRHLLLSKLEETLVVGDERFELSTNFYPCLAHPEGYKYLTDWSLDPYPVFTFEAGSVTVVKHVLMAPGENAVRLRYEVSGPKSSLELRPLLAFRGYHELTHRNSALNGDLERKPGVVSIQPYPELPRLFFVHNAAQVLREGNWYLNFEYSLERERGLDFSEDLFCPFVLICDPVPGEPATVTVATAENPAEIVAPVTRDLAGQFIVKRGQLHTVIAGYPWFTDWGRDTMIALPGLTLVTGKFDVARDILLAFSNCLDQGMLPNRFPDSGAAPEYNNVDGTLWFFEAIRKYLIYTGDLAFVRDQLYDKLEDVIEWHLRGTRYGIRMDNDGLLTAGDPATQLTWMDACVDGRPVTPRNGKPVEIQALWYNALRFMTSLAGDPFYERVAAKTGGSFNEAFWNEQAGCLYDVIDGESRDASLRPNQVIALSLGYCAIPEARARKILETVERHLLTPVGLRTLAPSDPRYQGRYEGGPAQRDAAYHQGTVWPWLLGPFLAADLRLNGNRRRAAAIVASFQNEQIPEIFDGDVPHEPRGCFAQAWSLAAILEAEACLSGVAREHSYGF